MWALFVSITVVAEQLNMLLPKKTCATGVSTSLSVPKSLEVSGAWLSFTNGAKEAWTGKCFLIRFKYMYASLQNKDTSHAYQNVWPQVSPLAHPVCNVSNMLNMANLPGVCDHSAHFAMRHLDQHRFLHERMLESQDSKRNQTSNICKYA